MVMENWASVREAAAKGEGPSVSAFASSSSSQHATSASSSSSSVKDDHTSPPNKSPQLPQPLPPPITDISRIIDELQSGDERAVEHGLFSLMPLLDRSANLDDPAQEPLRALLRQRVNQLLETLVDTFAGLYQASPSSPKGVTVMTQLHLLRATSHILEAVVGRPDLAAGVSSKTIAAYVRAMLPVRRLMPGLEELRAVFRYQSPLGKIRRLTDLMARHGSLILKRPSSIVGNHLDRSHLLVALLRETTAMLTRPLEPHFGYLLLQIARLNEAFVEWTEKKASGGGGMGGLGMAVRNDEPPVPGEEDEALEAAQQEHLFERLNLDLLLYEVDRLCYELLQRNFEGQYETWVNSLVEHLETLLKSLMTYARLTGHHILEHFVLVRATLADSVPYRYVAGRLMLLSGGRLQIAGFGGQYWPPPRATERLSEVLSDVQQIQAMARHYEAVGREDQGEELAMDLAMDRAMGFGGGGGGGAAMDEGIHFEVEEGGGGDEEEDGEGYNGEDDLEEEDDDDMVEDGLLPQDRLRRGPQPPEADAAPVVEADDDEETYEEEEEVEEDAECVASRQLLMRLVLGGHLGHRFGWATTALMALGEEGRQALQYHLPPPINDYGRPRAAVMAARANGYADGDGPHQELLQFHY